ncbi:hypothetical protein V2H45_21220 [Tumidithrix elongata RA019]|uniref:Uncharacterized protein n=1 Tax=Tumidithrix elongata BACA0141 TaxID=2716417 RepID=A0AAW9Q415_9CYAN|nr:hypothetical protein [Tumidithrix elongata RA019]
MKALKSFSLAAVSTLIAMLPTAAYAQQAPGMNWSWQSTNLSQRQCMIRAEDAMRNAGFSRNFSAVGESTFGVRSAYRGAIRCITSKGLVVFMVSGPSSDTSGDYRQGLEDNF